MPDGHLSVWHLLVYGVGLEIEGENVTNVWGGRLLLCEVED